MDKGQHQRVITIVVLDKALNILSENSSNNLQKRILNMVTIFKQIPNEQVEFQFIKPRKQSL